MFYWSQIPFVRISIPFVLGIVFQSYLPIDFSDNSLLLGLSLLFLVLVYFTFQGYYKLRYAFGATIPLLFFLLGILFYKEYNQRTEFNTIRIGEEIIWQGEVIEVNNPNAKKPQLICQVKNVLIGDSAINTKDLKTLAYFKTDKLTMKVGDLFWSRSKFQTINKNKIPNQFDYSSFLAKRKIYYQTFASEINLIGNNESINSIATALRNRLIDIYQEVGFTGDRLGILVALTLGNKAFLNQDTKSSFAQAGAMHILAVSGLHVGIVFMIFNTLLKVFPNKTFFAFLKAAILLFIIWSFALLTGFAPSVQRAACMFSIIVLATAFNRSTDILNSIFGSAFILLLINPNSIFEVGFQLSYSAVLGIVLVYPVIYPMLMGRYKFLNWFIGIIVVSLSAQLATLPFTLYYFHQFPNWFLLINIIVIPLAFALVGLSILLNTIYAIFSSTWGLNTLIGFLIDALNYSVTRVEFLPFPYSSGIWINLTSALILGALVIGLIYWLNYPKPKLAISSIILLCFLIMVEIVEEKRQSSQSFLGVYSNSRSSFISIVRGKDAMLVQISESLMPFDKKMAMSHLESQGAKHVRFYQNLDDVKEIETNIKGNVRLLQFNNSLVAIMNNEFTEKELLNFTKIDYFICLDQFNLFNEFDKNHAKSKLILMGNNSSEKLEKQLARSPNAVMLKNSDYYQVEM